MCLGLFAQENSIKIKAVLDVGNDLLNIQQEIIFYNNSTTTLNEIYLHNWANSYKNHKTKLTKRFVEGYSKTLYFAEEKDRGYSKIHNLSVNLETSAFEVEKEAVDILKISLNQPLSPKDSVLISATYTVKIPNGKFTGYGKTATGYHLRFWYLTPAIYKNKWQTMSNLNLDDLYENTGNFVIDIDVPKAYKIESNLYQYETKKGRLTNYYLIGKNKKDIILNIDTQPRFKTLKTHSLDIKTDVLSSEISQQLATDVLNRELLFIESLLGKYPHKEIFIDKVTQGKSPIYGLSQLPNFLRPFSDVFKWDLTLFKALSKKYIENTLLLNKRNDYWLIDGLQSYLMMEYVQKYYPEIKLLGKVADNWPIKNLNVAKLNFNDKYPFVYQFSTRKFLDQSLTTRADSLSNFNRKIVNKYKAGLGLRYLKGFVGEDILHASFKEFYQKSFLKTCSSDDFRKIITQKTDKDLNWFFGDYLQTNKKIDYTIQKASVEKDSIKIIIKNKRNFTAPIALYGVKNKEIKFKKWFTGIDSTKTVRIAKGDFDKLSLNYEQLYPEYNSLDNWKKLKPSLLDKPIQFKLFKDVEDPYYHQVYYQPDVKYNYYDGIILGVKLHNKPIIPNNFVLKIAPSYATKSNALTGYFSTVYNQYFENSKIYKAKYGLVGSTQHYAPNLAYNSIIPFFNIEFSRNSLRDIGHKTIVAKWVCINKEIAPGIVKSEKDQYNVLSVKYIYNKPDIIKGFGYKLHTEFSKNFTKVSADFRFRKLTASNRQLDFRVFAGGFLSNTTTEDYFSFGLDRANDYLFELNYLGRSESSGIFSQQFILSEGGFKSVLSTRFANQFMLSTNASIGLWRWAEVYNDIAFLKNKGEKVFFGYENGIRFNFVHNILEFYFPLHSNNGWEITQNAYPKKIRFVFTADVRSIYNFFRRGFF